MQNADVRLFTMCKCANMRMCKCRMLMYAS